MCTLYDYGTRNNLHLEVSIRGSEVKLNFQVTDFNSWVNIWLLDATPKEMTRAFFFFVLLFPAELLLCNTNNCQDVYVGSCLFDAEQRPS